MRSRRRRVLALVAALAALPGARLVRAQKGELRRIAILWGGAQAEQLALVRATLEREGFVEGRNLSIAFHDLPLDGSTAAATVEAVLRDGAELVIAQGPVVPVVHRAVAQRVPTVVAFSGDLVAAGLVDSLRRPGRRTTGVSFLVVELVGKRLELLVEAVPGIRRVGVLLNSRHYGFEAELAATRRAAEALRLGVESFDARAPEDFPRAFDALKRANVQGVVVFPDALMTRMAPALAEFSQRERLPIVAGWAAIARGGVLASYGPDLTEAYERVAVQAARVLRGADPSTMPVEQPTRIFIVVNLKTARSLGLALPPAMIARANEVIR